WRHTEFTGRYPRTIRSPHRSITSAKAVKRSIVSPRARSRWQFPCVASGSDRSKFWPARTTRINQLEFELVSRIFRVGSRSPAGVSSRTHEVGARLGIDLR